MEKGFSRHRGLPVKITDWGRTLLKNTGPRHARPPEQHETGNVNEVDVPACRLRVKARKELFERVSLPDDAEITTLASFKKTKRAMDRAAMKAAHALGHSDYYSLDAGGTVPLLKPSPHLSEADLRDLESNYRCLQQTQKVLEVLLDSALSRMQGIARLTQQLDEEAA